MDKKEVDACENCKTKLCESGVTMNNIPGLIDVFESEVYTLTKYLEDKDFEIIHGHRFNKMIKALTRTISILKSLDSGGKLVLEVEEIGDIILTEKPHLYLNTKDIEVIAKAIRSKLLINRAALINKLDSTINEVLMTPLPQGDWDYRKDFLKARIKTAMEKLLN